MKKLVVDSRKVYKLIYSHHISTSSHQRCSIKKTAKAVPNNLQYSQENTLFGVFLIKLF